MANQMTEDFFPDFSARFATVVDSLRGQRVVVLGHRRPDGDCIGSQVALTRCLVALGIEAIAIKEPRDGEHGADPHFVGFTSCNCEATIDPEGL